MARLILLYLVLGSIACGPSLRQTHVNAEYFERCYASDFDPALTVEARTDCWRHWLADHAEDQPPKRIKFAEERLGELAASPETRSLPTDAPTPAAAIDHEYPPAAPGSYQTTSGCDPICARGWSACTGRCELEDQPCKMACENEFRICVQGCP